MTSDNDKPDNEEDEPVAGRTANDDEDEDEDDSSSDKDSEEGQPSSRNSLGMSWKDPVYFITGPKHRELESRLAANSVSRPNKTKRKKIRSRWYTAERVTLIQQSLLLRRLLREWLPTVFTRLTDLS